MASVKSGHLCKAFLGNTGKPQIKNGFIKTSEVVNEHYKQAAVLLPYEEYYTHLYASKNSMGVYSVLGPTAV